MDVIQVKNKIYAGIGSRSTPTNVLNLMTQIARALDRLGWKLYTGGADGADSAFMSGSTNMRVFLPWKGFRGLESPYVHDFSTPRGMQAEAAVESYHPNPKALDIPARMLMARNTYQITGWNHTAEELVDLVLCWTPGAKLSGGTAQAMRIAADLNVPVVNLADIVNLRQYQHFVSQVMGEQPMV